MTNLEFLQKMKLVQVPPHVRTMQWQIEDDYYDDEDGVNSYLTYTHSFRRIYFPWLTIGAAAWCQNRGDRSLPKRLGRDVEIVYAMVLMHAQPWEALNVDTIARFKQIPTAFNVQSPGGPPGMVCVGDTGVLIRQGKITPANAFFQTVNTDDAPVPKFLLGSPPCIIEGWGVETTPWPKSINVEDWEAL